MRSWLAFLAVNAFLIGINALFAGSIFTVFKLAQAASPDLMEQPLVVLIVGSATLMGCLWLTKKAVELIGRLRLH